MKNIRFLFCATLMASALSGVAFAKGGGGGYVSDAERSEREIAARKEAELQYREGVYREAAKVLAPAYALQYVTKKLQSWIKENQYNVKNAKLSISELATLSKQIIDAETKIVENEITTRKIIAKTAEISVGVSTFSPKLSEHLAQNRDAIDQIAPLLVDSFKEILGSDNTLTSSELVEAAVVLLKRI